MAALVGAVASCDICYEPTAELRSSGCGDDSCGGRFCEACLARYCGAGLHPAVGKLCQEVVCPAENCGRVLPMCVWRRYVESSLVEGYRKRLLSSLSIVCPACHKIGRAFAEHAKVSQHILCCCVQCNSKSCRTEMRVL